MPNALIVASSAANAGKTLFSSALLYHYRKSVRPYKTGPDYIDIQFHEKICKTPSINLDGFMLDKNQLKYIFYRYFDKDIAIVEGVMGFYDGFERGASSYDIAKTLKIPVIMLLDGSGTYKTVSALLKGLKELKKNSNIKMVVINNINSSSHYNLIKNDIEKNFSDISVVGWIKRGQKTLKSKHLGLDLENIEDIKVTAKGVLENID